MTKTMRQQELEGAVQELLAVNKMLLENNGFLTRVNKNLLMELEDANIKTAIYKDYVDSLAHGPVGVWWDLQHLQRAWQITIKTAEAVIKNAERR